ncbi:hypothetical protein FDZ71_04145 [bacterium]|nr:MAG: hypothetical protein FDZ71_04145 [bacterium]
MKSAPGSHELRPLLKIKALYSQKSAENDLLELFKGQEAAISYLVADGWLNNPSREFLIAAARVLRKPGFTEMDSLSAIMDPQHLIESRSREINPCLLVGSFLDSGLIDLFAFVSTLRNRFSAKKFPAAPSPLARFGSMSEGGFAPFIEAVAAANTALREELSRIWEVLLDATDEGSPVFEIFWAETGLHRGGLQRMILRRLPAAVEAWTDGRDDKFLGELDAVESTIPRDGPLAARVLEVFRGARMKLKRECKDMVVWMEGGQRGDIVLIEKL